MGRHQIDDDGPYCPGGCITPLGTLDPSETVITESGETLCRSCFEAEESYQTDDHD